MASYDERPGGANRINASGIGHDFVMHGVLDASEANSGNGLSGGDDVKILHVPANCMVDCVRAYVETVEGSTLTFDVGDSGSATQWHSNLDGNATGTNAIDTTQTTYTSDDYILVTVDNAASSAKLHVMVHAVDMAPNG